MSSGCGELRACKVPEAALQSPLLQLEPVVFDWFKVTPPVTLQSGQDDLPTPLPWIVDLILFSIKIVKHTRETLPSRSILFILSEIQAFTV